MGKKWVLTMSAFSPRDLLSSSPREPLRSAWKCSSFHSLICINFCHYLCKWRRVSPAQCGGTARPIPAPGARRPPAGPARLPPPPAPSASPRPRRPGRSAIGFAGGDSLVAGPRGGGLFWAGVYHAAMGKREANDSQWLPISRICSALGPLISGRKSNM